MLDFRRLQSQLRRAVLARISSGQISGSRLARAASFKECHISNFLHERRGLSVEGMDRVLEVLEMSVLDLVPRRTLEGFAMAGFDREYESVPLVEANALHLPYPPDSAIPERVKIKRVFLNALQTETVGQREHWLRFVLMRASSEDADAMYPRIPHGSTLLIDRHYNVLEPHRHAEVNIYAVRLREAVLIRSLVLQGRQIELRPDNFRTPLEFLPIDPKGRYAEKIIGRVCQVTYDV